MTRGPSRSENEVMLSSSFDPGPDGVSAGGALSVGTEPFAWSYVLSMSLVLARSD